MALKKGYRLTEVGVIPSDWECKKLGEIADVVRGGSPRPAGDPKYFNGDFIPWLTVASLTKIPESIQEVTSTSTMLTKLGSLHSRILEKDTLIISNSGATLGVAKILGIKCCANDGVAALINQKSGCKSFLAHYINTKTKELHDKIATGNRQPNLNTDLIKNISVPFPPEDEQVASAKALNDVDALITQLQRLITKKHQIKQGAMQSLLNPFDKNGELKDGWERRTVFELADCKKELFDDGDWIEAKHITDKGVRLVQTGNIGIGRFNDKNTKKYIFESSFSQLKCKELQAGDLLICRLAEPAGRACIFPLLDDKKVVTSVDVTIFRPRNDIANRVYLSNVFSTAEWFSMINESVGGTTHKRISRGSLGKIAIFLPPIDEQNTVASILFDMDTEITALETKLVKTRQLKQGMMQSLLTGEIRLVTPNQD